jgi:hypothetical protein
MICQSLKTFLVIGLIPLNADKSSIGIHAGNGGGATA